MVIGWGWDLVWRDFGGRVWHRIDKGFEFGLRDIKVEDFIEICEGIAAGQGVVEPHGFGPNIVGGQLLSEPTFGERLALEQLAPRAIVE